MRWPYEFLTLSDEEKELRRQSLNLHASIAHYSAFAPALICLLLRLVFYLRRRSQGRYGSYQAVPGSPVVKAQRESALAQAKSSWSKFTWWMDDNVYFMGWHWGQRDEWILGSSWAAWLLLLCVLGTGKDFLHLTKRFGVIAVSQLPIQYLLALKALNPFALLFTSSHEQVNRYHRVLGRIIYALVVLHIIFYNVYFIAVGAWLNRFFAPIVFAGVVASLGLHALSGTAVAAVRNYSYRLFFIVHLMTALCIPPLIFFHAPSARFYVLEAIIVFVVDIGFRKATTIGAPSTLEMIPGTNMLEISATLPLSRVPKFQTRPGSHIYLNVPSTDRPSANPASPSSLVFEFMYNPFTVSSVDRETGAITLIARNMAGPLTNRLAALSHSESKVSLNIEGPYGAAAKSFSSLLCGRFDRILLFAGGVGATFALPVYHALLRDNSSTRVKLVWAVRSAGEATWAMSGAGSSVLDDNNVQLFLTGDMGVAASDDTSPGVEMSDLRCDRGSGNRKRPDVGKIVDDTFRLGMEESVAVLVCGPTGMTRDVRRCVRPWVMKGRRVWWHNEAFGIS